MSFSITIETYHKCIIIYYNMLYTYIFIVVLLYCTIIYNIKNEYIVPTITPK